MPANKGHLTIKRIERLTEPGRYTDGHGLYLQVINTNNRSWLLRYQRDGVERWMGLGPLHTFTLDEARERARKQRQLIQDGIDPLQAKQEERERKRREDKERAADAAKRKTFAECAEAFLKKHSNGWKNAKHRQQWQNTLRDYANPVIGKLFVSDIDTPHVVQVLERDDLWTTKRETARRVLGRVERILNFAKASGYRSGDNPAKWTGHLKNLLPTNGGGGGHHAAMDYDDVPALMAELRERTSLSARALEFTLLTAARTSETLGADWSEIDLSKRVWVIPADRMKAGKEHRVPLSDRVVEILRGFKSHRGPLFPLSNMAMAELLKGLRPGERATVHGFRSSFRDWAAERTNFANEVCEQALAHTISNAVEKAYRRGNLFAKREQLMQAWAKYCANPPTAAREANVVALRG